jgi:mRNA interferase RelE/StbE
MRRLRVPRDVVALVRTMHPELKRKLRAALGSVLSGAASGKALRDELAGLRSLRVGRYRVIYRESGKDLEIVAIGPRARIYEETYRAVRKGAKG